MGDGITGSSLVLPLLLLHLPSPSPSCLQLFFFVVYLLINDPLKLIPNPGGIGFHETSFIGKPG